MRTILLSDAKRLSRGKHGLLALGFMMVSLLASQGQTLTWDATGSASGPSDGSGTWQTSGDWWNGTIATSWVNGDDAVFGAGTNGAYLVSLGGATVSASNVTFNTSGYTLTNGSLTLEASSGNAMTVATGVVVNLFTPVTTITGSTFSLGGGATLSLADGADFPNNTVFTGGGTIDFNGGTFTGVNFVFWLQTPATQEAATINTARVLVGYAGNSTYTINNSAAQLICSGAGAENIVGRGGSAGTLVLEQGTVNWTATGNQLRLANDNSSGTKGTLTVEGGTFNLGANAIYINYGGTGANNSGALNLLGGTLTTGGIQFGDGGTYSAGSTASLVISGGTLYLGTGGISQSNLGTFAVSTVLSGGIIAATADWTSSNAMTLTTTNGNITFQAVDAAGNPWDISLSGALSGAGGLTKTGSGILSLSGTNTYTGGTTNNDGILAVTTASSGAGAYSVAGEATLAVQVAGTGTSLKMSSFTLNAGSTLNLDLNSSGNPTATIVNVSGALTPASTVTINLGGVLSGAGQFPLIKYGSLGGSGFGAFVLGTDTLPIGFAGSASLVNDTTNQSIDLIVAIPAAAQLTWDGTINGNWDIGATANWKTNAYYTQSNGIGSAVVFNDTASGTNPAIGLNTTVTPDSVTVSNSALTYSIGGSGGIAGTGGLIKAGAGTLALGGHNTYTGGTEINAGTLAITTTNNASMPYAVNGGLLKTSVTTPGTSLAMSTLACGSNSPQFTFDFGNLASTIAPVFDDSGNLTMDGNVTVNVTNLNLSSIGVAVLLRYAGERSGTGSFVAGAVPAGVTILDDTVHQQVLAYTPGFRVVVPSLNTNEIVVTETTPQQYGAVGDGVTDDSAAFHDAINAVFNSGGYGGGVVFVPAGSYAFYNDITLPTGVTLHGDWTDWTTGAGGLIGTTFNVYMGAGQTNGTPFITMESSTALRDVNIWYPNQSPTNITGYPFTIELGGDSVVQNVALVNSYQGIQVDGAEFILSTVIGTPLYMGFSTVGTIADISQTEDIRFSPAVWPASGLPNAPAAGGSYATWMRTYGTAMQVFRLDGLINVNTEISGYNIGLDFEENGGGASGCAFYNGYVTNCAIALNAQEMQTAAGLEFSDFTLDSDLAVNRTHTTNDAAAQFDDCQIIGRNGTAVYCTGASWQSAMAFQNCAISNALNLAGPGVFNLVDCALSGSTQCVISASATRVAFTGCTFSPTTNIVNHGNSNGTNLIVYGGRSISNAMPMVNWTNVISNYVSRRPGKTNLYVATSYGATGNGVADDTVAIGNALAAAGANGGGIVYLPAGNYHLTNTLVVPAGVELRGPYEMRHSPSPGSDGIAKGAILQPYGGQGTTNGPPAVALATNAGLVGMTISYESQWSNCFPYPPAIQGRGGNVYVIGVQCPNPYIYVDLDTYTCTNHFLDMVDGWALETGVHVGNGSSGSIVDCHANWSFWVGNSDSASHLQGAAEDPVTSFAMSNLQYYVLGNCTELFVKDFAIQENIYMRCSSENGTGPNVTAISAMCDGTYQCFVFDSTAPCTLNDVNPEWLVSLNGGYAGLTNQAILLSTTNFHGTVRFFNSPIWGSHNQDYLVNGGDIGFELVHMWQYAFAGSQVNGGVFHLINCGAFNVVDGGNGSPYFVTLGTNAGTAGKTNEVVGCFSYNGWSVANNNVANPENVWMDYALSNYSVLDVGPVVIGDVYPNGAYQFESSGALTFMAYSPNGINSNGITLQLTATNLFGQGYATNLTVANGLAVTGSSTTKRVGAPLATNALYAVAIQVTDVNGNRATNLVSFDTINPAYTFEAEDFDYNSGNYINNPQTDAYAGLSGVAGIDYGNGIPGQGSASYRPQGLETEDASDVPRLAYGGGLQDYDLGFANTGNWGNYTRAFPAGTYNIYMRAASPNGPTTDSVSLSLVTSGGGTTNQTTNKLGTFSVPNTGNWQTYTWVPLKTNSSTFAAFTGGAVETLKARTDNTGYNVNFYMLLTTNVQAPWIVAPAPPTAVTAAQGNAQVTLSWTASPAATSYNIGRSTTNGGPYAVIASNVTTSVYTNAGLTNGTTYYYVISSVSALGEGANSAQASATPVAPIPLAGSLSSNNEIMLSWATNGNGAGWTLYYSSELTPPITWVPVTNTPVLSSSQWTVTLPAGTNSGGFYRLQQ